MFAKALVESIDLRGDARLHGRHRSDEAHFLPLRRFVLRGRTSAAIFCWGAAGLASAAAVTVPIATAIWRLVPITASVTIPIATAFWRLRWRTWHTWKIKCPCLNVPLEPVFSECFVKRLRPKGRKNKKNIFSSKKRILLKNNTSRIFNILFHIF